MPTFIFLFHRFEDIDHDGAGLPLPPFEIINDSKELKRQDSFVPPLDLQRRGSLDPPHDRERRNSFSPAPDQRQSFDRRKSISSESRASKLLNRRESIKRYEVLQHRDESLDRIEESGRHLSNSVLTDDKGQAKDIHQVVMMLLSDRRRANKLPPT